MLSLSDFVLAPQKVASIQPHACNQRSFALLFPPIDCGIGSFVCFGLSRDFYFYFFLCDTYQLILRPVAKLACVWLHGPLTVALVLIRLCLTRVSVVVVLLIHRRIQTAYAASNYLFTGGGLCVQYFTVCLTHVVNVSGIVLPWAPRTQKLKSPSAEISGL